MPHLNEKSALLLKTAIDSGITSPAELANIMGNAAVETGHFSTMHENFGYRSVDRLVSQVQSSIRRFSREEIQTAIDSRDPQQIATVMYEGRSNPRDLGNTEPGDGWRFHGRGYFQYTGRNNYTEYSQKFGVDLVNNPDLAADPEMAAQLAISYWKDKVPEHMRNAPLAAGKKINGGPNGAEGRAIASRQWANKITPELVENIRSGRITLEQLVETTAQSRSGDSVRSIQKNLTTLGYAGIQGRALVPDGNYGPNTRHAVESFQRQHGLTADGIAGKETLNAIQHRVSALNPLRELELPGFDQALPGLPPELQARISQRAGGESERDIPRQATPVPQPSHYTAPMPSRTASPPAGPVRLPPMPPVEQLQPGTQGAAVFVLQEHLRMLNARDAEGRELKADRDYGPRTVQAVENFQLWAGLETTGSADRATLEALKGHAQYALEQREKGIPVSNHPADNLRPSVADIAVAVDQRPPPVRQTEQPAPPTLDQAPQIATLQSGLIQRGYHHRVSQPLQVNGQFDNATQQAVTAFQAQQNLPITSMVDAATQQALQQTLQEQQRVTQQEQQAQQAREQQQRQWQSEQDQRLQREQQARREEEDKTREHARSKEPQQPEALRPFSDPQHPEHALYADLKQRLEAQSHHLPEDRLHQITGALHEQRFKPDWQGAVGVVNDTVYVRDSTRVYARWDTSLQEPAPSIQDTMHAVQQYDQNFALQQQQTPQPDGPTRTR